MTKHPDVDAFLSTYPTPVQEIAEAAREFLKEALPDAAESVDESARLLAYSYGPGYKGLVCTLLMSQKEVKLGIKGGAALPDPTGLLKGRGKVHRHIPLRTPADLKQAGLKELIESALSNLM